MRWIFHDIKKNERTRVSKVNQRRFSQRIRNTSARFRYRAITGCTDLKFEEYCFVLTLELTATPTRVPLNLIKADCRMHRGIIIASSWVLSFKIANVGHKAAKSLSPIPIQDFPSERERKKEEEEKGKTESLRRWRAKKRTVKPFYAERSLFITRGNPLCFRRRLESRGEENRGRKKKEKKRKNGEEKRKEMRKECHSRSRSLGGTSRVLMGIGETEKWAENGTAKNSGKGNSRYHVDVFNRI